MVPAAVVDTTIADLLPHLESGDILIDGGNSYYVDDLRRARRTRAEGHSLRGRRHERRGLGPRARLLPDDRRRVAGREPSRSDLRHARPRSPARSSRTPGREQGGRHRRAGLPALRPLRRRPLRQDGPQRHRVRAHGRVCRGAERPARGERRPDDARRRRRDDAAARARALPVRPQPGRHRRSVAPRQRGRFLAARPDGGGARRGPLARERFAGRVSDSGEGRWTIKAGVDEGVPTPVLSSALYERFSSRGEADFADRLLSAMRHQFGGHEEKPAGK